MADDDIPQYEFSSDEERAMRAGNQQERPDPAGEVQSALQAQADYKNSRPRGEVLRTLTGLDREGRRRVQTGETELPPVSQRGQ
jgi:hypothetical protein